MLHYRRRTGSTNEDAKALAMAGAPCGTAVIAREQVAGQGRQGRVWHSPPGNLYLSVVLRPAVPATRAVELGLLAGVAVAEMLDAWLPPAETRLKWPNDVLVGGAKICGILLESRFAGRRLDWVVAGIGVNLRSSPMGAPYPTTSVMARSGQPVRCSEAARRLLTVLGRWVGTWETEGFAPVRAAWCARGHQPGEPILVRRGNDALQGRFLGIEEDGALALETAEGPRRIAGGEIASG